jgi:DNA end-binding protein Ku
LPEGKQKVAKREVEMAEQLIDSLTTEFDPSAYRDEYREQLLALIERKAEGKDVLTAPETEEPQPTKAPDLMAALEESIAAVKGGDKGKAKAKTKAKAKPAAKKKGKSAAKKSSGSRAKAKASK